MIKFLPFILTSYAIDFKNKLALSLGSVRNFLKKGLLYIYDVPISTIWMLVNKSITIDLVDLLTPEGLKHVHFFLLN